jgi:tRNA1Val (adenine37-N6)-methyltransferase
VKTSSEKFESVGIEISQPIDGHRYGEESLALAGFVNAGHGDVLADLCSGCGVIGLYIAVRDKPKKVLLVEIQPELDAIAQQNVQKNKLSEIVKCVNADYREFASQCAGSVDVIVSNPPFFRKGEGRLPPNGQKAVAKHELFGSLEELFRSAALLLRKGGRLAIVLPAPRRSEADDIAKRNGFFVRDYGTCSGGKFFICDYAWIELPFPV